MSGADRTTRGPFGAAGLMGLALCASVLAPLLGAPHPLRGNGGTLRVADAPVGAYRVSVYTDPTPPRPDSMDVSVLVLLPEDPRPVPDLEIEVRARPEPPVEDGGGERPTVHVVAATREQADDPRYYAAEFAPGWEGPWRVTVAVRGPEGSGEVEFAVVVREPGPLQNPWAVLVLALLPLAGAVWWLTRPGGEEEEDGAGSAPKELTP